MATHVKEVRADRCELCGYRSDGTFRNRISHLRERHPGYARGLLFRVVAPLVFVMEILILAAFHAPPWSFLVALGLSYALLFFGKQRSRSERRKKGARPTMPVGRLMREGGLGIVLVIPAAAILILILAAR
jgi:hypothetical protein